MLLFVIVERNEGGRDDAADGASRSRDGGRGGIDAVDRGVLLVQVDGDVESKQTGDGYMNAAELVEARSQLASTGCTVTEAEWVATTWGTAHDCITSHTRLAAHSLTFECIRLQLAQDQ
jgi:hypothetical protein